VHDLGVPSGDRPVAHLATPQWQSFEIRMRARKADRCLQRAAAALGDGSINEANAALEEARQLAPLDPRLEELSARLDALMQPAPPALAAHRHSSAWTTAAIVAGLAVFGTASWQAWVHRDQIALLVPKAHPEMDASTGLAGSTAAAAPNQPGVPTTDVNLPASGTAVPSADTIVQTTLVRPDSVIEVPVGPAQPASPSESTLVATAGLAQRSEPNVDGARAVVAPSAPEVAARSQREVAPLQSPPPPVESRPPAPLPTPSTAVPAANFIPSVTAPPIEPSRPGNAPTNAGGTNAPADAAATPPELIAPAPLSTRSAPDAVPASSSPTRDDRVAVRAALSRYESAYNRLDVDAVRSVWPSLDQRALARAFDGLTSQRVALQNCNVDVTGTSARASCSGNASWIPKVGSGQQSASRNWTFDLRELNGAWRIVHVQAR